MKLYGEISKTEAQDDGTIKVWGYASGEAIDSDGETITADAMKAALPDYMKFGAVREMHGHIAAGTALEAAVQTDGRTFFGAHVVDPIAVKKVQTGVYKGFSIGGKVTSRDTLNKKLITGIRLNEVSLVDRPANPDALITIFKADSLIAEEAVDELAKLLDSGAISPARLVELAKAEGAPATPAAVLETPPAPATPADEAAAKLAKGMYAVSSFAETLSCIASMASSAEFESQYEGDTSPVPAQLRAWVAAGVEIFKAMSAEETAELVASLAQPEPVVEVLVLTDKAGDLAKIAADDPAVTAVALVQAKTSLEKALARNEELATQHKAALSKLNGELLIATSSLEKAQKDHGDVLKMIGTSLGAKEGDPLAELAKAATTERDELKKRIEVLRAMPQPGKALLKAIGKGGDVIDTVKAADITPVLNSHGEENEVATLIKAAHLMGAVPLN